MFKRNPLDGDETFVREYKLSLGDASQFCNFAFLPQVAIDTVFFDGNPKHGTGALAVDVAAVLEHVQSPLFAGEPRDDTGFDGAEIRHDKPASGLGDEGRADQLCQDIWNGIVQHTDSVIIACAYQRSGLIQVRKLVSHEILDLYEPASPSSGSIGSVELQQAVDAPV